MNKIAGKKQLMKVLLIPILIIGVGIIVSIYYVKNPGGQMAANIISYSNIKRRLIEHLELVFVATFLAIATAIPLGILITRQRFKKIAPIIITVVNFGQTLPSLAVIGLMMGLLGLGFKTAIFALWVYSLLPILRNTYTGIRKVDPGIIDTAYGMGMKKMQILWKVELPLALYIIFAGIRTATVVNVGTAALATFIGAGGLGDFIVIGISLMRNTILLTGAILTALLAVFLDNILGNIENSIIV